MSECCFFFFSVRPTAVYRALAWFFFSPPPKMPPFLQPPPLHSGLSPNNIIAFQSSPSHLLLPNSVLLFLLFSSSRLSFPARCTSISLSHGLLLSTRLLYPLRFVSPDGSQPRRPLQLHICVANAFLKRRFILPPPQNFHCLLRHTDIHKSGG